MLSTDSFFDAQSMRTLAHTLYGGADFGECLTTMRRVTPGDTSSWYREWTRTADRVSGIADACDAAGHVVSAREAYLRASNYYRTSYLMLYGAPPKPELIRAYKRESLNFAAFASRAAPALEPVEIPYENTTLRGWFCPAATTPAPTLMATSGYDSTVSEAYFAFAVAANRRGYNCLLYDGPGQGHALIEQGLPMRPDWENVVKPVVDYLLMRVDVDAARIALAGWSLGGYLALRAAGGEGRLGACIADPAFTGLWEPLKSMFSALPPDALEHPLAADPALWVPYRQRIDASFEMHWKIVQRGFWVHGVESLAGYVAAAREYDNRQGLQSIRCPVFLAWEENDPTTSSAEEVHRLLGEKSTLVRFTADEGADGHCAMMARSLVHQRMFDWLDVVFSRTEPAT